MTQRTCTVDDCERPGNGGRGWCGMHYQRWKSNGDPLVARRRYRLAPECTEPDCGKPPYNRDLCLKHYREWQDTVRGPCSVEGCNRTWKSNGLCAVHYTRWRRHGTTDAPKPVGRKCSVEGCEDRVSAMEMCQRHRKNMRKHGAPEAPPRAPRISGTCCVTGCDNPSSRLNGMCNPHYRADWARRAAERPACEVRGCENPSSPRSTFCRTHAGFSASLYRTYRITAEQYRDLLAAQGGVCAICGRDPANQTRIKRLVVDHDHACCPGTTSCGQCVRGLLCNWCNRLIGLADDRPPTLANAIRYLERSRKRTKPKVPLEGQDGLFRLSA